MYEYILIKSNFSFNFTQFQICNINKYKDNNLYIEEKLQL